MAQLIWDFGWQEQDRHQALTPRQSVEYAAVDLQRHIHADTLYGDPDDTWEEGKQSSRLVK